MTAYLCERVEPTKRNVAEVSERRVLGAACAAAALRAFRRASEAHLVVECIPDDAALVRLEGQAFLWAEPADGRRRLKVRPSGRGAFPGVRLAAAGHGDPGSATSQNVLLRSTEAKKA